MSSLIIIYDGECPFCSEYVRFTHLRDNIGDIQIVDARTDEALVQKLLHEGYDLNKGMLAEYNGKRYFGDECMHLLALLSNRSGFLNKIVSTIMSNRVAASALYPLLKFGRNVTLKILRKKPI